MLIFSQRSMSTAITTTLPSKFNCCGVLQVFADRATAAVVRCVRTLTSSAAFTFAVHDEKRCLRGLLAHGMQQLRSSMLPTLRYRELLTSFVSTIMLDTSPQPAVRTLWI